MVRVFFLQNRIYRMGIYNLSRCIRQLHGDLTEPKGTLKEALYQKLLPEILGCRCKGHAYEIEPTVWGRGGPDPQL